MASPSTYRIETVDWSHDDMDARMATLAIKANLLGLRGWKIIKLEYDGEATVELHYVWPIGGKEE